MKKLLIIMLVLGLASGASAQSVKRNIRSISPRATIVRVVPAYPFYNPYYGFGYRYSPFYSPFYDPFFGPRYQSTPSELDLEIEDIQNEYSHKLSTVRKDKSLSKDERKQQIRDLKHEREDAIIEVKKNYYKSENSSDKS